MLQQQNPRDLDSWLAPSPLVTRPLERALDQEGWALCKVTYCRWFAVVGLPGRVCALVIMFIITPSCSFAGQTETRPPTTPGDQAEVQVSGNSVLPHTHGFEVVIVLDDPAKTCRGQQWTSLPTPAWAPSTINPHDLHAYQHQVGG